ncbi:MAG: AraC family transcriptional regulator [Eubacteriales bacterium]
MSVLTHYDKDGLYMHYSFDYAPDPTDFWTHFHDRDELLYVKCGKGRFISEGRIYNLVGGSVFIVKRGETHRLEIDPAYPYERMAFNFDRRLFETVDRSGILFEPFGKDNILYSGGQITDNLDKICRIPPDVKKEELRVRILSYLFPTLSEIACAYTAEGLPYQDKAILNMSVRLAIKYIHDHLYQDLSLDEIARGCFVSKSYISRLFRETTGKTIGEYITLKRLIAARRMLARGDHPTAVAAACGFKYYSTFWRDYQKVFGTAPSDRQVAASMGEPYIL